MLDTSVQPGIVDLHVGHLDPGWDSGSSCWTLGREAGIVDLHTLGKEAGIVETWEWDWDSGSSKNTGFRKNLVTLETPPRYMSCQLPYSVSQSFNFQLSLSHSFSHLLNTSNFLPVPPPPVEPSVVLRPQQFQVGTSVIPPVVIDVVDFSSWWYLEAIQIHPQLFVDVFLVPYCWRIDGPVPASQVVHKSRRTISKGASGL